MNVMQKSLSSVVVLTTFLLTTSAFAMESLSDEKDHASAPRPFLEDLNAKDNGPLSNLKFFFKPNLFQENKDEGMIELCRPKDCNPYKWTVNLSECHTRHLGCVAKYNVITTDPEVFFNNDIATNYSEVAAVTQMTLTYNKTSHKGLSELPEAFMNTCHEASQAAMTTGNTQGTVRVGKDLTGFFAREQINSPLFKEKPWAISLASLMTTEQMAVLHRKAGDNESHVDFTLITNPETTSLHLKKIDVIPDLIPNPETTSLRSIFQLRRPLYDKLIIDDLTLSFKQVMDQATKLKTPHVPDIMMTVINNGNLYYNPEPLNYIFPQYSDRCLHNTK